MARCPDLKNISDNGDNVVQLGDLLKYNNDLMFQYNTCAIVHDKLVEAIRKIQNNQGNK